MRQCYDYMYIRNSYVTQIRNEDIVKGTLSFAQEKINHFLRDDLLTQLQWIAPRKSELKVEPKSDPP
jgi:hypothetical protein